MYKYCFALYIVFYSLLSSAIEVKDLYVSKIIVNSQTKAERNKALELAMKAVILKVGGQNSSLEHPLIQDEIKLFNSYVRQYNYEQDNNINRLVVVFDETKINSLLVQANLAIWGRLRPKVLLWVVSEEGLIRKILSESTPTELPKLVDDFSNERGLPIIMPLMDLTDVNQISTSDIWGRFADPIKVASLRYNPEALVIVRISDNSLVEHNNNNSDCQPLCQQKSYAVDWSFISDSQNKNTLEFGKQYHGADELALLKQALSDITENIYQRYALSATTNNEMIIDVANIESFSSYITISSFLNDLSSVQTVKLISAQGTNRRFNLSLLGSKQSLLASLKLNKQLKQYIDPLADITPNVVPVFYWGKQ